MPTPRGIRRCLGGASGPFRAPRSADGGAPARRALPLAPFPDALCRMVFFPRLTTLVPAPLVSIVILTVITVAAGIAVPTVGDKGALPSSLPAPGLPDVPFTPDTLTTIAPYAFAMALVGLMESLMTARLVDEITDSRSSKTRESVGQGVADIVTGFFGGMGGCAMIGQTMINVKVSGARTRLSTFLAGVFLMVLCVVFGPVVSHIPMAALVAVMVMVCFATFDRHPVAPATLRRMPAGEIVVMVLTVVCVVATHNLAVGVVVGSVTAMVVFARRVARVADVTSATDPDGSTAVYAVTGELFFASANDLVGRFDYAGDPDRVAHRPLERARLGRVLRRGARCRGDEVRGARQDGRDHGSQPRRRRPPRSAHGLGLRPLTDRTGKSRARAAQRWSSPWAWPWGSSRHSPWPGRYACASSMRNRPRSRRKRRPPSSPSEWRWPNSRSSRPPATRHARSGEAPCQPVIPPGPTAHVTTDDAAVNAARLPAEQNLPAVPVLDTDGIPYAVVPGSQMRSDSWCPNQVPELSTNPTISRYSILGGTP